MTITENENKALPVPLSFLSLTVLQLFLVVCVIHVLPHNSTVLSLARVTVVVTFLGYMSVLLFILPFHTLAMKARHMSQPQHFLRDRSYQQ